MRVLVALAVLMAGVWAAVANLAPSRFVTDMTPLTSDEGRVASFSPDKAASAAPVAEFKTTVQVAATSEPAASTSTPEPESWVQGTTSSASNIDLETRASLARDIQVELARLGCYAGPVNGDWSADTQRAAGLFATEANARIPVDQPDFALFSLAKSATAEQACGPAVTIAQTPPIAPAMGLGGPGAEKKERPVSYRRDRDVEQLFTNPLGR